MQNLNQMFDEWLGDIDYKGIVHCEELYPFTVRVGVVKAANPRHERFEFIREMGASQLDAVFYGKPLGSEHLTFVFPERHMSVHEQQAFMSKLNQHPEANNIVSVDIITSSPLIVGNFHREMIRILTWEDDVYYGGK